MKNNTLNKVLIFTTGALLGSVVTWKVVKTKYERIAQEEIDSVKEVYSNRDSKKITDEEYGEDDEEEDKTEENDEETGEYLDLVKTYQSDEEVNKMAKDKPYIISPEEYDDGDYAKETLDYFEGDNTLVDAYGDVIENVGEYVPEDFADHFGEHERDTVYVRNDEQEIDYEICRDLRSYSEI